LIDFVYINARGSFWQLADPTTARRREMRDSRNAFRKILAYFRMFKKYTENDPKTGEIFLIFPNAVPKVSFVTALCSD